MRNFVTLLAGACICATAYAQDPIVQTNYTADPSPVVFNDTIFLYCSHDEDDAEGYGFKMLDWLLYTTTDMVNWTDHGPVASLQEFKWRQRDNGAWARQVVQRNGKYYMYCPLHGNGIGVLMSDSPYGPFKDPINKPLVWQKEHWDDIDPTVFIDDDGQAYMYWGNPHLYYVKLNPDMISVDGDIVKLEAPEHYQEGPWFYKRGDKYYLAFASTCCPEGLGYAMSDSPTGPWPFTGYIMRPTERDRGNHPGIVDYKGKTYIFGQSYDLLKLDTDEHHERRSINAAEMRYNEDGTIEEVPYWKDVVLEQIGTFNPYIRVEGETMAWGKGLKTKKLGSGRVLTNIDNGEYQMIKGVDFGKKGPKKYTCAVASTKPGSVIELRLDAPDGPVVGTVTVPDTQGKMCVLSTKIKGAKGIHNLYLCFKGDGKNLFDLDYWQFSR